VYTVGQGAQLCLSHLKSAEPKCQRSQSEFTDSRFGLPQYLGELHTPHQFLIAQGLNIMAISAVSLETESAEFGPKDSEEAVVEQPKRAVHDAEGLTPIQAISHGPITIGGTYFSLFLIIVSH
jgi:hypothetical protein